MNKRPSVVYVAPDKMGGMMNALANVLAFGPPDAFDSHVVLTHNRLAEEPRFTDPLPRASRTVVEYTLPTENLHAVMRRLARAIPPGPGVVVAGDLLDLATLSVHDVGRAVVLVLHGDQDYYYDLARKHDAVVHAYVAISRHMRDRLIACLPHRADSIVYIPHGVAMTPRVRRPSDGPLRLVFAGRLENSQKGVLDLPAIDARLRRRGVEARWTIIGDGPDGDRLRGEWPESPAVRYLGVLSNAETIGTVAEHDVLVLPTRGEGFPVSVLEAMSVGVVPVVSDIPSGVPEMVTSGTTGFTAPVGDIERFAAAIERLHTDRALLERMSRACRQRVEAEFDIRDRAADYHALFARYESLYRPLSQDARLQYGSRLDRKWMPNAAVYAVRRGQRWLRQRRPS